MTAEEQVLGELVQKKEDKLLADAIVEEAGVRTIEEAKALVPVMAIKDLLIEDLRKRGFVVSDEITALNLMTMYNDKVIAPIEREKPLGDNWYDTLQNDTAIGVDHFAVAGATLVSGATKVGQWGIDKLKASNRRSKRNTKTTLDRIKRDYAKKRGTVKQTSLTPSATRKNIGTKFKKLSVPLKRPKTAPIKKAVVKAQTAKASALPPLPDDVHWDVGKGFNMNYIIIIGIVAALFIFSKS